MRRIMKGSVSIKKLSTTFKMPASDQIALNTMEISNRLVRIRRPLASRVISGALTNDSNSRTGAKKKWAKSRIFGAPKKVRERENIMSASKKTMHDKLALCRVSVCIRLFSRTAIDISNDIFPVKLVCSADKEVVAN